MAELIQQNNLNGLRIAGYTNPVLIENFDFLKEYSFLHGLEIATPFDYSYEFLKYLPFLEHLNIQN